MGESIVGQQKTPGSDQGPHQRPYLRVANVFDDEIRLDDVASMSFDAEARTRYRLKDGDLLLCEGQSRELVGRAALYRGSPAEIYFQNTLIRFRPADGILPEYALLVFRAYQHNEVFSRIAKGTTGIFHLGLRRFQALPFPIPPRAVQATLVQISRAAQDEIDIARENLKLAQSRAEILPRIVRDQLILRGAAIGTPQWEELTGGQWQCAEEVVDEDTPIVYGIHQPGPDILDGSGVPYIRGQDLQDWEILEEQLRHTSVEINQKYPKSILSPGDVLLGIIRHTRVAIVPPSLEGGNITQGTAILRPSDRIDSNYLAHWLSSESAQKWLRDHQRGIDMPGLNLRDVRKLPIPILPIEQQKEIAALLDMALEHTNIIKRNIRHSWKRIDALEKSLLQSFAYGEVAAAVGKALRGRAEREESEELALSLKARTMISKQGQRTVRRRSGREERQMPQEAGLTAEHLFAVLRRAGGRVTPETLYKGMSLSDADIDTFFSLLRDLKTQGRLRVDRPDSVLVYIEETG